VGEETPDSEINIAPFQRLGGQLFCPSAGDGQLHCGTLDQRTLSAAITLALGHSTILKTRSTVIWATYLDLVPRYQPAGQTRPCLHGTILLCCRVTVEVPIKNRPILRERRQSDNRTK